jgi:hypothetical protein
MLLALYLLLNFVVLWIVARASRSRGLALVVMLFAAAFVVGSANNLLEAVVYGVLSLREAVSAAIPAAIIFAILSPAAVVLAGRFRAPNGREEEGQKLSLYAVLAVIAVYELLYWTAGTLVFPYIAHFYASKTIPPVYVVAGLQVVRSLVFLAAVYPLLRSGLRAAPIVLALIFSIIGGVAPLLPDNPYMPPDIRFYHGIETSLSNLLFGLFIGYVFGRNSPLSLTRKAAYPAPSGSS